MSTFIPERTAHPVGSLTRVKTPTVLQMQVTECGAASLGMVLAHHGRWVPLDELRERSGASRDGTTLSDLVKTAESFGMVGKGYLRSARLLPELGYPLILLWKGHHFLVLEGMDDEHAWLNDPASGPRRVPIEDFKRDYSRFCLSLRPGPDFTTGGSPPARMQGIGRRLRPVLSEVLAVVVMGVLATIPSLAVAAVAKFFVDDVLVQGLTDRAWPLVAALAALVLVQVLLTSMQMRILIRLGNRLTVVESARFVRHALRLP